MFKRGLVLAALVAAGSLSVSAQAQSEIRYRVQGLDITPEFADFPHLTVEGINNRGEVVGYAASGRGPTLAFLYSQGVLKPLEGAKRYYSTLALDINDRGQVAGALERTTALRRTPYRYSDGRYLDLGRSLGNVDWGVTMALNASGQAVGHIENQAFYFDGARSRFIGIQDAQSSIARGINDHGVVAGDAVVTVAGRGEQRAFIYDGQNVEFLPSALAGGTSLGVMDINNAGQVAQYAAKEGIISSYIYADGRFTDIGSLNGEPLDTYVTALNEKGWAVGRSTLYEDGAFHDAGFLYRDGELLNLNDLVRPQDAAGWRLTLARDINERGQIVGVGEWHGEYRAFIATPVPEPGAWWLMLGGLALVGAVARQRAAA